MSVNDSARGVIALRTTTPRRFPMNLSGKVAFVTGGSGDIGRAIVTALARAGADVGVSYFGSPDRAQATVDAVQALGRQSAAIHLDQRNEESIDACAVAVMDKFRRLDVLVNNAAWNIGIPFRDLGSLTAEVWDRVLETNVRGPYLLSRALAPELRHHKAGRIANVRNEGRPRVQSLVDCIPCRHSTRWQQYCVCLKQGRADPPDALPCDCACA